MSGSESTVIGVVVVTYAAQEVIRPCLDSLLHSEGADLRVVVCDNASQDKTVETVRNWANENQLALAESIADVGETPRLDHLAQVTLVSSVTNTGFAGGVNLGLRTLSQFPEVDLFWVLNPDAVALPGAASAYAQKAKDVGEFGLMGGRITFQDAPDVIQADGGAVSRLTGVAKSINAMRLASETPHPPATDFDYIIGANMVASRAFLDRVGLMQEDYFLYYEEIDWALRRGDLPIVFCEGGEVRHIGGAIIGSGSIGRRPTAFANYFNYRNRLRFIWRFNPWALPVAYAYSLLKIGKLVLQRAWPEAAGAFRGLHQLPPSSDIRRRLSPEAAVLAFSTRSHNRRAAQNAPS
ncbi:MAG: glycosyltransferase family 2 protein [Pseudomonadota bacterium]